MTMQTQQLHWWHRQLGQRLLADVTPALIVEYREKLAQGDGKPRANATVNCYLAALSHALTIAAREWGCLGHSPMPKVSRLPEPRGRVRFLSDDERQRLLDACPGEPESVPLPGRHPSSVDGGAQDGAAQSNVA